MGVMGWMHPPVHRLLGWVSRPSMLDQHYVVWRLDQYDSMDSQCVYAKGKPVKSDTNILGQLPTLLKASLLSCEGNPLGQVVDLVYDVTDGSILHYLVARSDPRLPGSSRWRLSPSRITDQHPGQVSSNLSTLDNLPLARASVRQELLLRSHRWREQLQTFSGRATQRLEGWLEELPWESRPRGDFLSSRDDTPKPDSLKSFQEEDWVPLSRPSQRKPSSNGDSELEEPWI